MNKLNIQPNEKPIIKRFMKEYRKLPLNVQDDLLKVIKDYFELNNKPGLYMGKEVCFIDNEGKKTTYLKNE